jgi:anti-anti-sigma factor
MDFTIDSTVAGTSAVIVLSGEFDGQVGEPVMAMAAVYLDKAEVEQLVIDLQTVTFLDSSGITALLTIRNTALGMDKQLLLRRPGPPAARVLQLVGLDSVFAIED